MLLTGEIWNPADLAEVETTVEQRIKYVKNNFKSDIKQLLNIGLTVEELTLMIQHNNLYIWGKGGCTLLYF